MFGLPDIKGIIENQLGLNTFGIGQLNDIEWGKKYLWGIRFYDPTPVAPFNSFFPATDVTVPEASLNSFSFEMGQSSFKIPQRSDMREISITFYDDANHTLLAWFRNWINVDILNNGEYVSCLKDSHAPILPSPYGYARVYPIRTLEITKLDVNLNPIQGETRTFSVYPEGNVEFQGGSASEANTYSMTFNIVGESQPGVTQQDNSTLNKAKKIAVQTLGRFF